MQDISGNLLIHFGLGLAFAVMLFLLLGERLFAADGLARRKLRGGLRFPGMAALVCFNAAYLLTVFLGHPANIKHELSNVLALATLTLLLPRLIAGLRAGTAAVLLRILMRTTLTFSSLGATVGLFCFAFRIYGSVQIAGASYLYGMVYQRLWLLSNPNFVAVVMFCGIWSAVALILYERQAGILRPLSLMLYSALLLVNFAAFLLAQSRATILAFMALLGLAVGFQAPIRLPFSKGLKRLIRAALALAAALLVYLLLIASDHMLQTLPNVTERQILPMILRNRAVEGGLANRFDLSSTEEGAQRTEEDLRTEADLLAKAVASEEGEAVYDQLFTNKSLEGHSWEARLDLWRYGLNYFAQRPILGYGIVRTRQMAIRDFPPPARIKSYLGGGFHNEYVSILAYSGVGGFLALGSFFILLLGKIFDCFRRIKGHHFEKFTMLLIPAMMVRESLEGVCVYFIFYESIFFWIVVGFTLRQLRAFGLIDGDAVLSRHSAGVLRHVRGKLERIGTCLGSGGVRLRRSGGGKERRERRR